MAQRTEVNSATGIMGPTGVGKSSLAYTLALYLWQNYKKVLLYYSSDGGGFPALVQKGQAMGIIRVFRMYTRDPGTGELSEETCYRSAQGWWPKRINPATGEVPPGIEMVPPFALKFAMSCPKGHLVKVVPSQHLLVPALCPECKSMVTKTDMRVEKTLVQNKGFEDVGGVFYDGLTSMLAWIMRDLGHRAGRMELKGEEGAIGGKVASGDMKFGGSTRSHVGFAQARGEELVHLTLGIHGLMVPPVFTMLTHEDVDERSLSIRGPKIAGRAKTDEAPQWFGNMIEAAKVPAQGSAGEQRVLYLNEFTDTLGIKHLCKHRGAPGTMPAQLMDPPEDPAHPELCFTQFNLGLFFSMLNVALEQEIERGKVEVPDAPGLPDGMVEYGEMSVEVPGQAVATVAAGPQTLTAPPQASVPVAGVVAPAPTVRVPKPRAKPGPAAPPATAPVAPPIVEMPSPALPAVEGQGAANAVVETPVSATVAAPEPMSAPPAPVEPAAPPVAVAAPPVAATPTPAPAAPGPLVPAAGVPAQAAPRPAAAPPPGRRPAPAAPGTPPGAMVSGPAAPRPVTAAPRPPAAAPRPPTTTT